MPVKNYVSRNGQVEYEYDDLGDILTYGRDAQGNVVAGYDAATNAVFTADYKPYGEFAATTGNVAGRRFMWVGSWGYRFTSGVPVSHYVRARHLSMRMGMWTSVDLLWPRMSGWLYGANNPVKTIDYFGLAPFGMRGGVNPRENPLFCKAFPRLCDWSKPKPASGPAQPPWLPPQPSPRPIGPPKPGPKPTWWGGRDPGGRTTPGFTRPGDPVSFSYGNHCGADNWKKGCGYPPPIDCIDAACEKHDACLGVHSYWSLGGAACHCTLLLEARNCQIMGCKGDFNCMNAATQVIIAFNAVCFVTTQRSNPWGRPTGQLMPSSPMFW